MILERGEDNNLTYVYSSCNYHIILPWKEKVREK